MRLQSLPRCRAAPGASARAAAVLGWCSPQSSVPRQTVGHHARAAMYEMGLTASRRRLPRRGAMANHRIPPAGLSFPSSHIPTGQGAATCTARRALGWISQSRKTHLGGFCKKWARELAPTTKAASGNRAAKSNLRAGSTSQRPGLPQVTYPTPPPGHLPYTSGAIYPTPHPTTHLPSHLSYTYRPPVLYLYITYLVVNLGE